MKKMKLKNKQKRKLNKIKIILILIIFYLSFSCSYYINSKYSNIITNKEFINLLLNDYNTTNIYKIEPTKTIGKTLNYIFNIDIKDPKTLLNTIVVTLPKKKKENSITVEEAKKESDYIEDPNPDKKTNPIVYIYNTHQLESYNSDYLKIYGIKPNVQMASYLLKEKLNKNNINTIVEDENITKILESNSWPYYKSYDVTRNLINKQIKNNPSLKYFIDIHRDSIEKKLTTINIEGKYYAKILFVLGLENKTYKNNLSLMEKVSSKVNELYPGLSRGILKKEGKNVNGVYNQDINENVILIEVGSYNNTIEEVYNTVNAISEALTIIIGDDKN